MNVTEEIHKQGVGKSASAKEICAKIRACRRANALEYAKDQPERLRLLEKEIRDDNAMKQVEKMRMLVEIERIRQQEITSALPSEQVIKVDDDKVGNSRELMAAKLSEE